MQNTRKKLFFLFLLLLLIGIGVYFFFLRDTGEVAPEPTDTGERVTVGDQLGLGDIEVVIPPEQIPFVRDPEEGFLPGQPTDQLSLIRLDETIPIISVEDDTPLPRLFRLFEGPTAGYRVDQKDDGSWVARVLEQGRGNRYIIDTSPYSLDLVTNGEFTKVVEGYIFANGSTLVMLESDIDETITHSVFTPFTPTPTNNTVQRFEDNIRVATNDENLLFFIHKVDEKAVGLVVDVSDPENTTMVWESTFGSWLPRWGRNSYITLSTPISQFAKGYVYLVDPAGEEPMNRFVDLSTGGSAFMDTSSGYFFLYEIARDDFAGKASVTEYTRETAIDMPITLPEKCDGLNGIFVCAVPTVIPSETVSGYETRFPDSWYQGDISFDDSVVLIDAVTGEKRLIMSSDQPDIRALTGGSTFDIIDPRISDDGRYLFFIHKGDLSLWMLRL